MSGGLNYVVLITTGVVALLLALSAASNGIERGGAQKPSSTLRLIAAVAIGLAGGFAAPPAGTTWIARLGLGLVAAVIVPLGASRLRQRLSNIGSHSGGSEPPTSSPSAGNRLGDFAASAVLIAAVILTASAGGIPAPWAIGLGVGTALLLAAVMKRT